MRYFVSCYFFLKSVAPKMRLSTTSARKTKKITCAIEAAPCAMPVNPNSAATIAITRNMAVHFNIIVSIGLSMGICQTPGHCGFIGFAVMLL